MKIGRNDPCPCGSGKKYKHCCLNNPKPIPFPRKEDDTSYKSDFSLDKDFSTFSRMTGLTSEKDFKEALDDYSYYCENILEEGERVPTFKEYVDDKSFLREIINSQKILSKMTGARTIKEADALLDDAFSHYNAQLHVTPSVTIEEKLGDLAFEGPFRASSALEINKKVSVGSLRNTLLIHLSWAFLEFIVRGGGSVPRVYIQEQEPEVFFDILGKKFDLNALGAGAKNKKTHILWLKYIEALLISRDFAKYTGENVSVTDKGLKFLSGRNVKSAYFQLIRYLLDSLNWFYDSGLPEQIEIIQDLSGAFLLFMEKMAVKEYPVSPAELAETADFVYHFYDDLESFGISRKLINEAVNDFFLEGCCLLAGFIEPFPGKNGNYRTTDLSRDIFKWKI